MGKLFIIAVPSGVGKGTILKEFLAKNKNAKASISSTTRKPRQDEVHGVDYFFVSGPEFKEEMDKGEFLEWAQYSTNFYGTHKKQVEKMLKEGFDVILEIEVQGAIQVMDKVKDAISVFIVPPSLEELERRLRSRETDDEDVVQRRLAVAKDELAQKSKFTYIIENDKLEKAIDELQKIYEKSRKK